MENNNYQAITANILNDLHDMKYNPDNLPILEQSAEKTAKYWEASYRLSKRVNTIVSNVYKKVGKEKLFDIISKLCTNEDIDKCKNTIIRNSNNTFFDGKQSATYKDNSLSFEQKEAKYLELLGKNRHNEYYAVMLKNLSSTFQSTLEKNENVLYSFLEELDNNNCLSNDIFPDKVLIPTDDEYESDVHIMDAEINSIISTLDHNKDKDTIDALKYANEIIITGNPEDRAKTSSIAEDYGKISERVYSNKTKNHILECITDKSFLEDSFNINVKVGSENAVKLSNALKEISDAKIEGAFNKNVAKELCEIVKYCEDTGIFDSKSLSGGEASSKIYSLKSLCDKRFELENAVKEKNFNEVKRLSAEYKTLDTAYMNVIEKLKKFGIEGEISGNISCSRETIVPKKYVNDYIGVSRLNNLWNIYSLFKRYGFTMEQGLADPNKVYRMIYEQSIHGDNETDYFLQTKNNLEVFRGILFEYNLFDECKAKDRTIDNIGCRGINNLGYFLPEGKERMDFIARAELDMVSVANNSDYRITGFVLCDNPGETLSNILITEPKDRNLFDMSGKCLIDVSKNEMRKPYPSVDYIKNGKTSIDNILGRSGDLLSILSYDQRITDDMSIIDRYNNVVKGFKALVAKINQSGVRCTKQQKEILKKLDNVRNAKPLENKMLAAKLQALYYSKIQDHSPEACEYGLYNLARLRAEWKGRNRFFKMFGPETRRLSNKIEEIKDIYKDMGYTGLQLDQLTAKYNNPNVKLEFIKEESRLEDYRQGGIRKNPLPEREHNQQKDLDAYAKVGSIDDLVLPNSINEANKKPEIKEEVAKPIGKRSKITIMLEESNNIATNDFKQDDSISNVNELEENILDEEYGELPSRPREENSFLEDAIEDINSY